MLLQEIKDMIFVHVHKMHILCTYEKKIMQQLTLVSLHGSRPLIAALLVVLRDPLGCRALDFTPQVRA